VEELGKLKNPVTSSGMYLSKQSIGVPLNNQEKKRARKEIKILRGKSKRWMLEKKDRNKMKVEKKKVLKIQNYERNIQREGKK
jgi:hypothetical protein